MFFIQFDRHVQTEGAVARHALFLELSSLHLLVAFARRDFLGKFFGDKKDSFVDCNVKCFFLFFFGCNFIRMK